MNQNINSLVENCKNVKKIMDRILSHISICENCKEAKTCEKYEKLKKDSKNYWVDFSYSLEYKKHKKFLPQIWPFSLESGNF